MVVKIIFIILQRPSDYILMSLKPEDNKPWSKHWGDYFLSEESVGKATVFPHFPAFSRVFRIRNLTEPRRRCPTNNEGAGYWVFLGCRRGAIAGLRPAPTQPVQLTLATRHRHLVRQPRRRRQRWYVNVVSTTRFLSGESTQNVPRVNSSKRD